MNVFKYYPPCDYHFDALLAGYFFFCKVLKLNDPFDASFDLIQSPSLIKFNNTLLTKNAKKIMDDYGTCSFSTEKGNKMMWALYADNYKGFVVEFDDTTFESLNSMLLARISYQKVVYHEKYPNLDDINYSFDYRNYEGEVEKIKICDCLKDEKTMDKLFTHLCSYKHNDWCNEKEWRLIAANDIQRRKVPLIKYEPNGYKIPMPQNSIKSIIIGHNMSKDRYCCIEKASIKWNVPVLKTKIGKPFEIEFEEVVFGNELDL